jgi:predicted Rossmann-fold nucleotide-binding protein
MTSIKHYLDPSHCDLITPDGTITNLELIDKKSAVATVFIEEISPIFVGFDIDKERIFFNIKSTLAQLGVDGKGIEYSLDKEHRCAEVKVMLTTHGTLGERMLSKLIVGAHIGKLFAADERRRVREPYYLSRMFGRSDQHGSPLLSLGGLHGSEDLILDVVDGRAVAYLSLQNGRVKYVNDIEGFINTIAKALVYGMPTRRLLRLHQEWDPHARRNIEEDEILLVRTLPLHIRTVFGMVVQNLLSEGYQHTSASILQPDTSASGDIYELFGSSKREITDIPLEFYTLEPYREHVFFSDRDQLQVSLENDQALFKAFDTAPDSEMIRAATFVVKGQQMSELKEESWIARESRPFEFPGPSQRDRQSLMVERYVEQQPSYPFLKSIEEGIITSQGILLAKYFPSPLMKRMLIGHQQQRCLKRIYFQKPSKSSDVFFSAEDRNLLHDLEKFGIPVYWVDTTSDSVLQYAEKEGADSGMFVPQDKVEDFMNATIFGIYGSNLVTGPFEETLRSMLGGIKEMRETMEHPLLNKSTPLALVTGGGPGAMELGNKVAKELGILSCANIMDFRMKGHSVVNEQKQNPYVEAKMTYRIDKLVERQAEFNLDFPIFLNGGIGTDFEYSLEEVRRKVGSVRSTPTILMGEVEYWREKITHRFQKNLETGTIKGSEWVSNCFYCVQTAEQAIKVYRQFFDGTLQIGKDGPMHEDGFVIVE